MDIAQFLNFMIGSAQAIVKPELAQKAFDDFVTRANKDLRAAIESSMPVVYLVDAEQVLNNLYSALGQMTNEELNTYIEYIDTKQGKSYPTDIDFEDYWDIYYEELVAALKSDMVKLVSQIDAKIKKTISVSDLSKEALTVASVLENAKLAYLAGINNDNAGVKQYAVETFQKVIREQGTKFRTYIRNASPAQLENPQEFVLGYRTSTQRVVIADTYSKALEAINRDCLTPALHAILKSRKIIPRNNLTAGSFTAAGHAAAIAGTRDNVREIIGINTPLTQSTLLLAQRNAQQQVNLDQFIKDSGHLDTALQISENYSKDAKVLLSLGFSFLISMESAYNATTLRTKEVAAMNSFVEKAFRTTTKKLRDQFLKNLFSKEGLQNLVSALRLSPTLKEGIEMQIIAALSGTPFKVIKGTKKTKNRKSSKTIANKKVTAIKSSKKGNPTKAPSKTPKTIPISKSDTVSGSLASLQKILDSLLVDKIKENMGNGARKDILNLRTGRFAESVKIERLSKSREGMITAFYTYMKNPYATFSVGGRQELPKTRDPKLLISKSIRELLQAQVANRLRAVSL